MKKLVTLLSLLLITFVGNSQVLGIYEFTGAQICPVENPNVTTQPTGATFSAFSSEGVDCAPTSNVFNSQGWSTEFTDTSYYEFSISADLGKVINLDSIIFSTRISNSDLSVPTWHLRSNIDNFAADITTGFSTSTLDTVRYKFGAIYSDLASVTFRLYVSGVDTDQRAFRVDNVSLKGEIVSESTSSVSDNNLNTAKIFPNPGKESVSLFLFENVEKATITIYTTSGQVVTNSIFSGNSTLIQTENLKKGMYFIQLNDGNNSSTFKWTKE
jgi:hypothetical protein